MRIGVAKEIKSDEARIALLPVGAELLKKDGHEVYVQSNAGLAAGFPNDLYIKAGAQIVDKPEDIYGMSDIVVKVKEPMDSEFKLMKPGQVVFGYFHFAASEALTRACLKSHITAIAYETLYDRNGRLPLLTPMSEIAGKLSIQAGAQALENPYGGRGVLMGGVTGVAPAEVVVLGAGIVGSNAALMAAGLGANVTIMDINLDRLRELDLVMPPNVHTRYCDPHAINEIVPDCDLFIGSVLVPGARAPKLIRREHLKLMKAGSAIVDVCIDQGGCAETAKPTTHKDPTYIVDDIVHYCVANMPGAVAHTATRALCNATLPYLRQLARMDIDTFIEIDAGHAAALNMRSGELALPALRDLFHHLT